MHGGSASLPRGHSLLKYPSALRCVPSHGLSRFWITNFLRDRPNLGLSSIPETVGTWSDISKCRVDHADTVPTPALPSPNRSVASCWLWIKQNSSMCCEACGVWVIPPFRTVSPSMPQHLAFSPACSCPRAFAHATLFWGFLFFPSSPGNFYSPFGSELKQTMLTLLKTHYHRWISHTSKMADTTQHLLGLICRPLGLPSPVQHPSSTHHRLPTLAGGRHVTGRCYTWVSSVPEKELRSKNNTGN